MGNPFLFADRFSGAVVHLTAGKNAFAFTALLLYCNLLSSKMQNARDSQTDAGTRG
jgi:hypothetical protein